MSGTPGGKSKDFQVESIVDHLCNNRYGDHVERVIPLGMQYARQEDDELKKHVLQVGMVLNILKNDDC